MSSGFCVRVLVLLLLTFCQHVKALRYFDFQRSLKPASSENLEPAAAPGAGGPSGSSGRQVDGYSPEGSVSSYRPGPLLIQKSRQKLQQPLQNDPNAGVLQTEAEIPQTEYRESGISSRYGITLYFPEPESTWQAKPEQRSYPAKSQQLPSYPAKPQLPAYPAKPQLPAYPAKPQLPAYPAKPQLPAYPAKPQQRAHPVRPQQRAYPDYLSKPQQRAHPVRPQQRAYPDYLSKPQQPADPFRPQQRAYPDYPSKPTESNPKMNLGPRSSIPMASPYHPRWKQPLIPVPVHSRYP